MTARDRGARRAWSRLALMVVALGCAPAEPEASPSLDVEIPAGWVEVVNTQGTLRVVLPPWLRMEDNHGAIFAKEPPGTSPGSMTLWVQGPQGIEDEPSPGQDFAAWIEGRLQSNGGGEPVVTPVHLPAGRGVRYDIIEGRDGPQPWRTIVFAVQGPSGVGWLQVSGPADAWPPHLADVDRLALLLRFR